MQCILSKTDDVSELLIFKDLVQFDCRKRPPPVSDQLLPFWLVAKREDQTVTTSSQSCAVIFANFIAASNPRLTSSWTPLNKKLGRVYFRVLSLVG